MARDEVLQGNDVELLISRMEERLGQTFLCVRREDRPDTKVVRMVVELDGLGESLELEEMLDVLPEAGALVSHELCLQDIPRSSRCMERLHPSVQAQLRQAEHGDREDESREESTQMCRIGNGGSGN